MDTIINVQQLTKRYGNFTAVDGLSFTVNKGDVYGFLGQNGAGKSTSIRMMLTLIQPTSGNIELFGKNLRQHRHTILSQTGAVIERPDLYKYLSAYDNLSIFARMSGLKVTRKLLMDQLEMVGLTEAAHKKFALFSQGMKQRLGIAVALVHNPELIILDEPTNGLDPQGIADIRNLIIRLRKEMGKTVLISSHLLHEVEQVANRMIIIHKGKKIIEGDVTTLLDPSHTLVQVHSMDDATTAAIIAASSWNKYLQGNTGLQLLMNRTEVPQLIDYLVSKNVALLAVNAHHSLENYFLSLTNDNGYVDTVAD